MSNWETRENSNYMTCEERKSIIGLFVFGILKPGMLSLLIENKHA